MVPLEVQFDPRDFQEEVVVIVSFFKILVIVSFFKNLVIVSFFKAILIVFFSFFSIAFFIVLFLQSFKKFNLMAGIELGSPEWQAEMITIAPFHSPILNKCY